MREPGGANAVVHSRLHKYYKFLISEYFIKTKRQLIQSCLYSLLQVSLLVKLQLPILTVLLNLVLQNYHH